MRLNDSTIVYKRRDHKNFNNFRIFEAREFKFILLTLLLAKVSLYQSINLNYFCLFDIEINYFSNFTCSLHFGL